MYLTDQIKYDKWIVWVALFLFMAVLSISWLWESPLIALIPFALALAIFILRDLSLIYFLLFVSIPFSSEIEIVQGMVLDLPSEPFMIVLLVLSVLWLIMNKKPWGHIILHPITILLLFHLAWMSLCALGSVDKMVSFKFLLSKFWYVAAFYLGTWFFIQKPRHIKLVFWCLYIPLLFTVLWVLVRHVYSGFSFDTVNSVVQPFYRNHVDYASLIVLSYPLVWLAYRWYEKGSWQSWLIFAGLLIIPIGIYFSYTRAAIGILVLYPFIYFILKWKMVKWALIAAVVVVIGGISYFLSEKEYISLAPNYERTIYHDEFGNLLEATYKLEDLSTMERLYRWVAGGHMLLERPWMGSGPGTFYPTYQAYTVSAFQTYTSHNPDKSGVHNYYLMTATDQGVIGLFIWLVFIVFVLLFTENIYHKSSRGDERLLIAAIFCIMTGILIINTINDMMENLKVGSLFFFGLAIIAMLGRHYVLAPPTKDKP